MDEEPQSSNTTGRQGSEQQPAAGSGSPGPIEPGPGPTGPTNRTQAYSDEFQMFVMKVQPCNLRTAHPWTECPYAHPSERAARRDPRSGTYTGIACLSMKQEGRCALGATCPHAHSDWEYWLHPSRYHTALCNNGTTCTRKFCFFAHHPSELRTPPVRPAEACPSAGALAAANSLAAVSSLLQQQQQLGQVAAPQLPQGGLPALPLPPQQAPPLQWPQQANPLQPWQAASPSNPATWGPSSSSGGGAGGSSGGGAGGSSGSSGGSMVQRAATRSPLARGLALGPLPVSGEVQGRGALAEPVSPAAGILRTLSSSGSLTSPLASGAVAPRAALAATGPASLPGAAPVPLGEPGRNSPEAEAAMVQLVIDGLARGLINPAQAAPLLGSMLPPDALLQLALAQQEQGVMAAVAAQQTLAQQEQGAAAAVAAQQALAQRAPTAAAAAAGAQYNMARPFMPAPEAAAAMQRALAQQAAIAAALAQQLQAPAPAAPVPWQQPELQQQQQPVPAPAPQGEEEPNFWAQHGGASGPWGGPPGAGWQGPGPSR